MNARRFWTGLLASLFLTLCMQPAWAQTDIFIEILEIPGEALAPHEDWIEALGCAEALLNEGKGGVVPARVAGRPKFAAITCTKHIDLASPLLRIDAASNTVHESATIDFVRSIGDGPETVFKIELWNVAIREVSMAPTGGDSLEEETVKLTFERICWTYFLFDNSGISLGSLKKCWDVVNNQELTP